MPFSTSRRDSRLLCVAVSALAMISLASIDVSPVDDFPAVTNSQRPGDEPTSPEEAIAAMTFSDADPNWRVTLFAAEPDVQQPIAFDFDDRGRLWIAENYSYAGGPYDKHHRDRVIILEDVDGDGRHDRRTMFWDDGWMLTGLTWGFGGLWVLSEGTLAFIPDRNGDDAPDGEPTILLDGWTFEAGHNFVNGLLWGPDGWLYGRHGISDTSYPGIPGTPREQRTPMNCGIWRFHPTRSEFEVVCRGTTNPWGLDYDEHGQMFFTNNVIGHLWHVIPGAHYRRMFGVDFNPHLYGLIDQHADHYHWDTTGNWSESRNGAADSEGGGHSHSGGMIYLGDNWPERYRGSMFLCNTHGRRVNSDMLERHGSGYRARHAEDFLVANQPWFRGIELKYGPDGGVYLTDWVDNGECHDHDGVHRTSGRIYKITHGRPLQSAPRDMSRLTNDQLVSHLTHKNQWYVRRAQRLLQERAAAGQDMAAVHYAILQRVPGVRKLQALSVTNGVDEKLLGTFVFHPDNEHVRSWCIRTMAELDEPPSWMMPTLLRHARSRSQLVRLTLASTLQRLPHEERWEIAGELASHAEDADDHNLPLMIWYGIEPVVPTNPRRAVAIATQARIPLVRQYITRRLASDYEEHRDAIDQLLGAAVGRDDGLTLDVLRGLSEALRGVRRADPPGRWDDVSRVLALREDANVVRLTQELSLIFGDGRAVQALVEIARDADADPQARSTAIASLVEARAQGFDDTLLTLISDRVVQEDALAGLAAYAHPQTAETIVGMFPKVRAEAREQAVSTLAARPEWALTLLKAVQAGRIDTQSISAVHARLLTSLSDDAVTRSLERVWGVIDRTDAQKEQAIAEWSDKLTPASLAAADLTHGRILYHKTCGTCHKLYGEGGTIAPELTGSNRHNLRYLLENILDPHRTVPRQWTTSVLVLRDGRVLTGVVTRQTDRSWTVQTANEELVIPAAEIEESRQTNLSLMPEGQLHALSERDVRDLIAYLQTRHQVPSAE